MHIRNVKVFCSKPQFPDIGVSGQPCTAYPCNIYTSAIIQNSHTVAVSRTLIWAV